MQILLLYHVETREKIICDITADVFREKDDSIAVSVLDDLELAEF